VIVGLAPFDIAEKRIFDYDDISGEPHEIRVKNISPYLLSGTDIFIVARSKPLSRVPEMQKGSQATDGGNLLLSDNEKVELLKKEPQAEKFIRPFLGSDEFINGIKRWCLWLVGALPTELRAMPQVLERIEKVRQMRLESTKPATVKWAQMPTLFTENRQPENNYLLIPRVSSENRRYIPIGYLNKQVMLAIRLFRYPMPLFITLEY
jgi:hypothetical protein